MKMECKKKRDAPKTKHRPAGIFYDFEGENGGKMTIFFENQDEYRIHDEVDVEITVQNRQRKLDDYDEE